MVLELHVFGPAFGLPSIDVECLATIIYLRKCFSHRDAKDNSKSWQLVASNDLSVSPFRRLPALRVQEAERDDGYTWIAGFENIITYLKESSDDSALDLDADFDDLQRADNYALLSFIRSRGGSILDLSMYVSSENYNSCTRPALGELLHWPESWTLPHKLREDARRRSEHLGLSALDVDTAKDQQEKEETQGLAAHIPKSLRKPKQTVSGLLGKSAQQTKFRLEAVTDAFLEPLIEKLQSIERGTSLLGNGFHSADCLAVAYLTLMQQPEFPQAWLQKALASKYSTLGGWANRHAKEIFGASVTATAAVAGQRLGPNALPWAAPSKRTISQASISAIESLVSTIPGLRLGYDSAEIQPSNSNGRKRSRKDQQLSYISVRKRQILYCQIITSTIATTSVVAWLAHAGILRFSARNSMSERRNFGEAGSLLGIL